MASTPERSLLALEGDGGGWGIAWCGSFESWCYGSFGLAWLDLGLSLLGFWLDLALVCVGFGRDSMFGVVWAWFRLALGGFGLISLLGFPRLSRIFSLVTKLLPGFYEETGVLGGPGRSPGRHRRC